MSLEQKAYQLKTGFLPGSSIRARLAFWYAGLLLLVLLIIEPAIYVTQTRGHLHELDSYLQNTAQHLSEQMVRGTFTPEIVQHHETPLELLGGSAVFIDVYNADKALLAVSENAHRFSMIPFALSNTPVIDVRETENGRIRIFSLPAIKNGKVVGYVEIGASLHALDTAHTRLRNLLWIVSLIGMLVALVGGWLIASSALEPVTQMAKAAQAVALSKSFNVRLPVSKTDDELSRLAVTFNSMLTSLEEAYEQQRRFIDDASHELRAPLTSVRGNLDLLMRTGANIAVEERQAILGDIQSEVGRLMRLVNELLILARSDQGQSYEMVPVELDRVLMDVHRQYQPLFGKRQLLVDEIRPVVVSGQPDHLYQLMTVLVDNALKYTPAPGEVVISLTIQRGSAVLTVRDTGIGIAKKDIPHVFDRFYRADPARQRDRGGTGLGLSIAKAIVEEHGGDISVSSSLGKGSEFVVRLPLPNFAVGDETVNL